MSGKQARYYLCPHCKKSLPVGPSETYSADISFCDGCGAILVTECPDCDEPIKGKDAKYCPYCGASYFSVRSNDRRIP